MEPELSPVLVPWMVARGSPAHPAHPAPNHPLPIAGSAHGQAAYLTQNTGCFGERKRRDLPNRNWGKKLQK